MAYTRHPSPCQARQIRQRWRWQRRQTGEYRRRSVVFTRMRPKLSLSLSPLVPGIMALVVDRRTLGRKHGPFLRPKH